MTQESQHSKPQSHPLFSVTSATISGVISRYVAWPLEKVFYQYMSLNNVKSYYQLFQSTFTRKGLYDSHTTFLKAGTWQTIGKSLSNFGVVGYVEHAYAEDSSIKKGMKIAFLSAPLETLFTTSGELNKYKLFSKTQNTVDMLNQARLKWADLSYYGRAMLATYSRALGSGCLTYGGIYSTEYILKTTFSSESEKYPIQTKMISAMLGSSLAQPFIMPLIHFQNYFFEHGATQPAPTMMSCFSKSYSISTLVRGAGGRALNRSVMYGLGFFCIESSKSLEMKLNPDVTSTPGCRAG